MKYNAEIMLIANAAVAAYLPLRLIAPCSRHAIICGPNAGLASNHASNLGELCAKQYAAKMTNGTVGTTGNTAPIAPNANESHPAAR